MNARTLAVLALLLAVLGGGALLIREQGKAQKPPASGTLGQPLLKSLKAADIAAISIRDPKGAITLQRKDERWAIAERDGFAADLDKVRSFVLKAIELKIGQAEPIGEKDRARLQLDASGTTVAFQGADGKPLAQLVVGKKHFKREPDDPAKALGDGRFVLVPGDDKQAYIVSDALAQATTRTAEWIAKTGVAAEKIRSVEFRGADGTGWKIERSGDNADWKLAGARADEKVEAARANSAAYTFAILDIADVAPKGLGPDKTGLDKPAVATAATFDGLTYVLKIGKTEGDNYYATVALEGAPKPEGKDAEERMKKLEERLPRERALAGHTLLIGKAKLEDLQKKRVELLAAKEDKKK
jgi:hypothetical protein